MVSNYTQEIENNLSALSDTSRVWIWQAKEPLTDEQIAIVKNEIAQFIPQWTCHNQSLSARGILAKGRFLIICLDQERSTSASGCSIDALTHMVQNIGNKIQSDFFDRNIFYYLSDGEIKKGQLSDLSNMHANQDIDSTTLVFDPLLNSKARLLNEWPKPLATSWHKRFL